MSDERLRGIVPPLKDRMLTVDGETRFPHEMTAGELKALAQTFYDSSNASNPIERTLFERKLDAMTNGNDGTLIPLEDLYRDPEHSQYVVVYDTDDLAWLQFIRLPMKEDFSVGTERHLAYQKSHGHWPSPAETWDMDRQEGFVLLVRGSDKEYREQAKQALESNGYPIYQPPTQS